MESLKVISVIFKRWRSIWCASSTPWQGELCCCSTSLLRFSERLQGSYLSICRSNMNKRPLRSGLLWFSGLFPPQKIWPCCLTKRRQKLPKSTNSKLNCWDWGGLKPSQVNLIFKLWKWSTTFRQHSQLFLKRCLFWKGTRSWFKNSHNKMTCLQNSN